MLNEIFTNHIQYSVGLCFYYLRIQIKIMQIIYKIYVFNYELHGEKQHQVSLHDIRFVQPLFTLVAIQVSPVDILGDAIVSTVRC